MKGQNNNFPINTDITDNPHHIIVYCGNQQYSQNKSTEQVKVESIGACPSYSLIAMMMNRQKSNLSTQKVALVVLLGVALSNIASCSSVLDEYAAARLTCVNVTSESKNEKTLESKEDNVSGHICEASSNGRCAHHWTLGKLVLTITFSQNELNGFII